MTLYNIHMLKEPNRQWFLFFNRSAKNFKSAFIEFRNKRCANYSKFDFFQFETSTWIYFFS